ncbi:hypothetical protein [Micromonospora sp. NBC_00421]|uniref:hypothetical protein n=1 Tax=Micromonospora sp. NBC_00421 TaxID=2975976 RepID=UPI002E228954
MFLGVWDRQPDPAVGGEIVNGEPGLIATDRQSRTLAVLALATTGTGRISHVWVVRNPRKLDAWRWSPTAPDR